MGVTFCRKLYYLNIEDEEINIGNLVSKRPEENTYFYEQTTAATTTKYNNNPFVIWILLITLI